MVDLINRIPFFGLVLIMYALCALFSFLVFSVFYSREGFIDKHGSNPNDWPQPNSGLLFLSGGALMFLLGASYFSKYCSIYSCSDLMIMFSSLSTRTIILAIGSLAVFLFLNKYLPYRSTLTYKNCSN